MDHISSLTGRSQSFVQSRWEHALTAIKQLTAKASTSPGAHGGQGANKRASAKSE